MHKRFLVALTVVLAGVLIPAAASAQTPVYITQWGTNGTGDGQFDFPYGVAVDASGNVYVADYYNNRIQKFTSSGTFLTKWGPLDGGDGQFDYPQYVAVDALGNVYVTDYGINSGIQKFTSAGTYVTQWPAGGLALGVAVDGSGNVYVADAGNYKIQKFTSDGDYVAQWGSLGGGTGSSATRVAWQWIPVATST
jgi:tripartite motif-containing protein 71